MALLSKDAALMVLLVLSFRDVCRQYRAYRIGVVSVACPKASRKGTFEGYFAKEVGSKDALGIGRRRMGKASLIDKTSPTNIRGLRRSV
jgi:hypothetical protein